MREKTRKGPKVEQRVACVARDCGADADYSVPGVGGLCSGHAHAADAAMPAGLPAGTRRLDPSQARSSR